MKSKTIEYEVVDFSDWQVDSIIVRMERLLDVLRSQEARGATANLKAMLSALMELDEMRIELSRRLGISEREFDALCFAPINMN